MKRFVYERLGGEFVGHGTVNHSTDEYVRSGGLHHTNTVESFFCVAEPGILGSQPGNSRRETGKISRLRLVSGN